MKILASLLIVFCSMAIGSDVNAQFISTIAGCGIGDDSLATAAELFVPLAVVKDKAGNIYISDPGANRVRKVDASGILTTYAGTGVSGFSGDGGPANLAQFSQVGNMTIDRSDNLYVCDGYRIRKIDN